METATYLQQIRSIREKDNSNGQSNREKADTAWTWISFGLTSLAIGKSRPELMERCERFVTAYYHSMHTPLDKDELRAYHAEAVQIMDQLVSPRQKVEQTSHKNHLAPYQSTSPQKDKVLVLTH
jgi:penicillin V acylase-like amidase (Ntn superfamily)